MSNGLYLVLADMPALGIERYVGAPRRERLVKARPLVALAKWGNAQKTSNA